MPERVLPDDRALALAFAEAVGEEIADLFAAGVDIVQIDEPYLQARPEAAREYAVEAINRALSYATGKTALHSCFGYAHFKREKSRRSGGYPFLTELNDVRRRPGRDRGGAAEARPRAPARRCVTTSRSA